MDSNILESRGFSLAELSIVLVIATIVITACFCLSGKIRQTALAQRTIEELNVIAAASLEYYSETGAWPIDISGLRPRYLSPQSSSANPFGYAYMITPGNQAVSVSTLLPMGLVTAKSFGNEVTVTNQGSNDLVSVTKSLESIIWKLKYEKKNIFKQ